MLAQGNSSVALVASMHPAVLSLWLATDEVADPYQAKWDEQRQLLGDLAKSNWFGTITSEPGSGGDCRNRGPLRDRPQTVDGCCPARNTSAAGLALRRSC